MDGRVVVVGLASDLSRGKIRWLSGPHYDWVVSVWYGVSPLFSSMTVSEVWRLDEGRRQHVVSVGRSALGAVAVPSER